MSGDTRFPAPGEPNVPFYRHAVEIMEAGGVPYLVGGAYALTHYTGIVRHTKDFDLFIHPADIHRTLGLFRDAGYRAEVVFSHWLGKVYHGDDFVDIIFSSGNGWCTVDDTWFEHAEVGNVLGLRALLIPAEEMIWQKSYIMERERFDGADVIHLIRARGNQLDWDRLLARFGNHWRVLFGHLVFFGFVYPGDQGSIPRDVLRLLTTRFHEEIGEETARGVCRGPLVSRTQYLPDVEEWGYTDPRIKPAGPMTEEQAVTWTDAGR